MKTEEFVDRIIQLDESDRIDLAECIIALNESDTLEETQVCRSTIIEILENEAHEVLLLDFDDNKKSERLIEWCKQVGETIKQARIAKEFSISELAESVSVPQSYMERLENGTVSPSNKALNKIADALGVDPTTFYPAYD